MTNPASIDAVQASDSATQLQRPARALIGWMDQSSATAALNGQVQQNPPDPEHVARVVAAHVAVDSREVVDFGEDVVREMPAELGEHADTLMKSPQFAPFVAEGWTVAIADLSKVCALQPSVFTDHALARAKNAIADDWKGLAAITLPHPSVAANLPFVFSPERQAFMVSSPNPNLRVAGHFAVNLEGGVPGLGFAIVVSPSFVQVAQIGKRFVLRDGYHRAYGLLAKGIRWVPVVTKVFQPLDELGLPGGMLPRAAYLGDRPPTLADYHTEVVSAETMLPATQKLLIVQALELGLLG